MNAEKRKRLQAAGWAVGNTSDFLGLTTAEAELAQVIMGSDGDEAQKQLFDPLSGDRIIRV